LPAVRYLDFEVCFHDGQTVLQGKGVVIVFQGVIDIEFILKSRHVAGGDIDKGGGQDHVIVIKTGRLGTVYFTNVFRVEFAAATVLVDMPALNAFDLPGRRSGDFEVGIAGALGFEDFQGALYFFPGNSGS